MESFSTPEWLAIALCILITGMSRGGFPISGVALPLLILLWPEPGQAARSAVSFMLPMMCVMDLVGVILYRGKPDWSHIRKLMPATIAGVALASMFFVSDKGFSVSDRTLKLLIGILGLTFTAWQLWGKKGRTYLSSKGSSGSWRPKLYGFSSGVTSTIAHAAGPVMQMYLLPTGLAKAQFAATSVYFFLFLNTIKLIPFAMLGRFNSEQLTANLWMVPILPVGVLIGFGLVRIMPEHVYTRFIYFTLVLTSVILIYRALTGI
jgi:uncharacterized membrane protein YfcA